MTDLLIGRTYVFHRPTSKNPITVRLTHGPNHHNGGTYCGVVLPTNMTILRLRKCHVVDGPILPPLPTRGPVKAREVPNRRTN